MFASLTGRSSAAPLNSALGPEMAKTDRLKTLEQAIRNDLAPALAEKGFEYDGKCKVFRKIDGECTQIIEVQAGVRSNEGQFTVNLAIFHPEYCATNGQDVPEGKAREYDCLFEYRQRLATLRDTPSTKFFGRHISDTTHWFKWWLVTPSDRWWNFSSDITQVRHSTRKTLKLLNQKGFSWLAMNCDTEKMKECYDQYVTRTGTLA